jgi:hypothetical protein
MEQVFGQIEHHQNVLELRIRALQMLISSVTDFEYDKLKGLATNGLFLFDSIKTYCIIS